MDEWTGGGGDASTMMIWIEFHSTYTDGQQLKCIFKWHTAQVSIGREGYVVQ